MLQGGNIHLVGAAPTLENVAVVAAEENRGVGVRRVANSRPSLKGIALGTMTPKNQVACAQRGHHSLSRVPCSFHYCALGKDSQDQT